MSYYKNLSIITNEGKREVQYDTETGHATIYAQCEDDIKAGIADLEARGVLEKEKAEADGDDAIVLQAFCHAIESMDDEAKDDARFLAYMLTGQYCADNSIMFATATGFLMGMTEGMRIADILNEGAKEQAQG